MSENLPFPSLSRKLLLLLSALLFFTSGVFAQTTTITGKVTDKSNNGPIPGVTVRIKNSTTGGATTDSNGAFSIKAESSATLVFTFIGYTTAEVAVDGRQSVNVSLAEGSNTLNEVVAIGYGTRQKRDVIGAIATINSKDIERSTALTPELALQGQTAGVFVSGGGSSPTARPTVRIRGVGSFGNAEPLYVIDGIPLTEGGAGVTVDRTNDPTLRGPVNIFTIINPADIESMSVLKDASAAAVYGVRAANGVVLITTKKGKKGQVRVDVDGQSGSTRIIKNLPVLNTQQYTKYFTDYYNSRPALNGTTPISMYDRPEYGQFFNPAATANATFIGYIGNLPTYDWQSELQNKKATITSLNVRASGGTDNTTYSVSGGYSKNDAPFKGVTAKRYSVSSNVNSKIGKYIEAGLNLRLIQQNSKGTGSNTTGSESASLLSYQAAPFQPIYDQNGVNGFAPLYYVTDLTPTTFTTIKKYGNQFTSKGNYLGSLSMNENFDANQSIIGTAFIQAQPFEGFKIKATYSGTQFQVSQNDYTAFDSWIFEETPKSPYSEAVNPPAGSRPNKISTINGTTTNILKSINLNYNHNFGKHNIDLLFDASQQDYKWVTRGAFSQIFTSDPSLRYYGTSNDSKNYYNLNGQYALIGYLGRITYNFDSKYYVEGLIRRDGSSRFAPGHQWGTFPSASAGWRISQENFMKDVKFVNDLKLRGGYGILGNEQTTAGWAYLSVAGSNLPSYTVGDPNGLNPENGIAYVSFPNTGLTWEKLHQANIGFDAMLLNNSINFTFDFYNKVTKGIIQSVAITPSSGFQQNVDQNIAEVLNRGFEFTVGYNKTFGKVGLNISANLATLHNEVLELDGNTALRGSGLEVGQPLGFIYGYQVGGIFQSQAEIDAYNSNLPAGFTKKDQNSNEQKPGDMYFQDMHGTPAAGSTDYNMTPDGIVNSNDQTNIGNTIPKIVYGFNLGANYANFDVSLFFQGVGDVQRYNYLLATGTTGGYGRNQLVDVLNSWTPSNPSSTTPRAVYADPNANSRFSSRFVESAAYLRFQNATIGYTLPRNILDKSKVFSNLRVFATGINLFTITGYSYGDPEVSGGTSVRDYSPNPRQFLLGFKASF